MQQHSENLAVVQAALADFTNQAFEALLARLSDDIILETALPSEIVPYGGKHAGKAAARAFLENVTRTTQFMRFAVREFFTSPDAVVALGSYESVVRGIGRPAVSDFAMVFRLREGKIAAFQKFADTHAIVQSWK
jgi:uncharacterized protein